MKNFDTRLTSTQTTSPIKSKVDFISKCNDAELWKLFIKGHEGAFTRIYETYFDLLYNYGVQLGFKTDNIEDVIQELFISLRLNRGKLALISFIKPYLFKAFRRDMMRVAKQKKIFFISFGDERDSLQSIQVSTNQEVRLIEDQMTKLHKKQLERAINSLSARQREAIYHFYYEGFGYAELAEIMQLSSPKVARNLVYKAINGLRENKSDLPEWIITSFFLMLLPL